MLPTLFPREPIAPPHGQSPEHRLPPQKFPLPPWLARALIGLACFLGGMVLVVSDPPSTSTATLQSLPWFVGCVAVGIGSFFLITAPMPPMGWLKPPRQKRR